MKKKKPKSPSSGPVVKQEPPRLLGKGGRYVQDPKYALGMYAGYSSQPKDPEFYDTEYEVPPEPEGPSVGDLKWITEEARTNHIGRVVSDQKSRLQDERRRLSALLQASSDIARERGIDIRSDVRIVERRIAAIDRKLGLEKAA